MILAFQPSGRSAAQALHPGGDFLVLDVVVAEVGGAAGETEEPGPRARSWERFDGSLLPGKWENHRKTIGKP